MKWFKHFSDAYSNIKIQHLIAQFGMEGYGFFWVCCELVAQQGDSFRIKGDKNWKKVLSHLTSVSNEKRDELLSHFGAVKLIDEKALKNNDLFIPKMQSYSDEYTDKLRRVSRQARDNVGLEQIRTDKKKNRSRTEEDTQFNSFWKIYPKKVGKAKAFEFWGKLTPSDKESVLKDIPLRLKDDKWLNGFVKDPERYIKSRQWEDEIIKPKQSGQKPSLAPKDNKYAKYENA